jgi:hypothetical protein
MSCPVRCPGQGQNIMSIFKEDILMTAETLIKILSLADPDTEIMIEYLPRPHEYITEYALGVRMEDNSAVIFGVTSTLD